MILRPVRPVSPCGPPITKRPVGLMWNLVFASIMFSGRIGSMMCFFDFGAERFGGNVVVVLRGYHHGVDAGRLAVDILDADLALAIRAQELEFARAGALRSTGGPVCEPA